MIYPLFFPRFRCRAGRCRHTCCAGWEITVDAASAERYAMLPGALGQALRENILQTEEGACFRLTKEGRCPFLTEEGLCRLISEGGGELLCDVCREHPRFYGEVGGKTLAGLGLSCEAAAALVLRNRPLRFADADTGEVYAFGALSRALGVELPRQAKRYVPVTDPVRLRDLRDLLLEAEPIDEEWGPSVRACFSHLPGLGGAAAKLTRIEAGRAQNLYEYIFYRRLPDAPACGVHAAARFARLSVSYIMMQTLLTGSLTESARRWSEEIEYSDVNTALLLERFRGME